MNWHVALGVVSGIISMLSVLPYIKDIRHGTTRPNTVSWALWVLLLLISVLAQWSAAASWSIFFLIGDLVGTASILVLCLVGYGYKQYGTLEWSCLALALIAIVLWKLTHHPVVA